MSKPVAIQRCVTDALDVHRMITVALERGWSVLYVIPTGGSMYYVGMSKRGATTKDMNDLDTEHARIAYPEPQP